MAVPSSGSLSLFRIANEKNVNDYTDDDTETQDYGGISLRGVSNNSFDDFGTGNININTDGWSSPANTSGQTGSAIQTDPYSMSEFYGYDHDFVAEIHATSFQPDLWTEVIPYSPLNYHSGFEDDGVTDSTMSDVTIDTSVTIGGKTGNSTNPLKIYAIHNSNTDGSSTTGTRIILEIRKYNESTSFSNSSTTDWNTLKIWANSSGTGTPLITLTRSGISTWGSGVVSNEAYIQYIWTANRAFSSYFGTNTTASSNTTHYLQLT
jgi:hypothetical protein